MGGSVLFAYESTIVGVDIDATNATATLARRVRTGARFSIRRSGDPRGHS